MTWRSVAVSRASWGTLRETCPPTWRLVWARRARPRQAPRARRTRRRWHAGEWPLACARARRPGRLRVSRPPHPARLVPGARLQSELMQLMVRGGRRVGRPRAKRACLPRRCAAPPPPPLVFGPAQTRCGPQVPSGHGVKTRWRGVAVSRKRLPWAHATPGALTSPSPATQTGGDTGISAFPDGDNIFKWVGTIQGPAGTVRFPPRCLSCREVPSPLAWQPWTRVAHP